jgi:NADPH:quinone reductase-like Zn-dependent oxidoreductase
MKALSYEQFGEASAVVRYGDHASPEPGHGQVRLALIASPIHTHDLMTISGHYGIRPPLPAVPGSEALGVVEAVGEGVHDVPIGARVVTASAHGAWAEKVIAPAASLVTVPKAIADGAAAQLVAMPLSAWALLDDLALPKGAWIAQNAANGTVGRIIDLLAHERGLHVLNVVRSGAAAEALSAKGAANVVSTEADDWVQAARTLAGGAPIAAFIDSISGEASAKALQLLPPRGILVSFGALSRRALHIDPGLVIAHELVLRGFWATAWAKRVSPETIRFAMHDLVTHVADGAITLEVEAEFPLAAAAAAFAHWSQAGKKGKILFKP